MASPRILLCGDVLGRLNQLFKRVNSVNKSAGPFDALFCVGQFFPDEPDRLDELMDYVEGRAQVPLPTYFIGDYGVGAPKVLSAVSRNSANQGFKMDGFKVCDNLFWLKGSGMFTFHGLSVAYLSGRQLSNGQQFGTYSQIDIDTLRAFAEEPGIVDFFLSNEWPSGITNRATASDIPAGISDSSGSDSTVSQLVAEIKPRYHIAGTKGAYYAREPYCNVDAVHVTRFLGLASVGNKEKQKFLHALSPTPSSTMAAAEISAKPPNTTLSPYTLVDQVDRPKETTKRASDIGLDSQYWRYDVSSKRQKHGNGDTNKVCFKFISSGTCPRGEKCNFPHDADAREQFLRGVCLDFIIKGKCEKGPDCNFKHSLQDDGENHSRKRPTLSFWSPFLLHLSMMKGGFEVVHATLDMIQPHREPIWDFASFGFPTTSVAAAAVSSIPRQSLENRCINLERNELSDWVEQVTKKLIDDLPAQNTDTDDHHSSTLQAPADIPMVCEDSFPPSLLGDFRPRKTVTSSDFDELQWSNVNGGNDRGLSRLDEQGLSLITLLLECAVAISIDNLGEAHRMLLELTQMASPYALSCAERVVAYFAKAMSSRVINSWLGICSPLINYKTVHCAFQAFNNVSPFIKFAHFTSNQAILEAFHRRDRVHIIDLDIMQGLQWPALFHILATRMEGPPHVTMTGMGSSMELLTETGKQLSNFAKRLGMSFEFHPIAKKFGEIDITMVRLRRGETLAIHWLQHSLYDATGPDWKTMRLMEQLGPRIITLVEQDLSHGGSFLDRFVGSLHYYSTMFDSLGAYLAADDPNRHRIEHCLLFREINNILAIGGPARSGEDKMKQWRSELAARNSFVQVPMSSNSMAQAQLILNMFPPAHGYRLVQGDGTLRLGWKDTSLFTASAWTSHVSR